MLKHSCCCSCSCLVLLLLLLATSSFFLLHINLSLSIPRKPQTLSHSHSHTTTPFIGYSGVLCPEPGPEAAGAVECKERNNTRRLQRGRNVQVGKGLGGFRSSAFRVCEV